MPSNPSKRAGKSVPILPAQPRPLLAPAPLLGGFAPWRGRRARGRRQPPLPPLHAVKLRFTSGRRRPELGSLYGASLGAAGMPRMSQLITAGLGGGTGVRSWGGRRGRWPRGRDGAARFLARAGPRLEGSAPARSPGVGQVPGPSGPVELRHFPALALPVPEPRSLPKGLGTCSAAAVCPHPRCPAAPRLCLLHRRPPEPSPAAGRLQAGLRSWPCTGHQTCADLGKNPPSLLWTRLSHG